MKIPAIVPVSDLRQDVASVLKMLQNSPDPLVITQHGRAVAVIQGIEGYEQSENARELLHRLAIGEKEIASDEGHSLESVMSEAEALLEGES